MKYTYTHQNELSLRVVKKNKHLKRINIIAIEWINVPVTL